MKKVTLIILMFVLVLGASGGYGYYAYVLEDEDDDVSTVSSEGNPPIARITPSMPKVGVDENITFSATDSTDLDGDELTYSWSFEGDGMVYSNASITRSYSSAGEYKVTLSVTDSTGLSDETETTVKVVSNYQETFTGGVEEGQSDVLTFPVELGALTLQVNWSLNDQRQSSFAFPSEVDLTLEDSNGTIIRNETGEQAGDGEWEITSSSDLQATGDYKITIECTDGGMDYTIDVTVRY